MNIVIFLFVLICLIISMNISFKFKNALETCLWYDVEIAEDIEQSNYTVYITESRRVIKVIGQYKTKEEALKTKEETIKKIERIIQEMN